MKHQVHRLIAMLITLLIVCSVLSPVAYCENNSYGSMVGRDSGKETGDEEKEDGKEEELIEEGKPVTFGETSTIFDVGWEETGEVTIVETVQSTSGSNTVTYKTYKTRQICSRGCDEANKPSHEPTSACGAEIAS